MGTFSTRLVKKQSLDTRAGGGTSNMHQIRSSQHVASWSLAHLLGDGSTGMAVVSSLSAALKLRFNTREEVKDKEDTRGLLPVRGLPLLVPLLPVNVLLSGAEGDTRMPMDRPTST